MDATIKLVLVSGLLLGLYNAATSYTCSTPKNWLKNSNRVKSANSRSLGNNSQFASRANILSGVKWPGGIVTYKFHHSLTLRDIPEIKSAFEEYESRTCIRFQPWKEGDLDYVSIEVKPGLCGLAHVCKIGGYQFAQFGGTCREKATMIHELGHTICLGHEDQRSDRDKYLKYPNCKNVEPKENDRDYTASGLYDFSSQMHYECNSCLGGWPKPAEVTKCGPQAGSGLSALDVDKINELYDCQGCYRHRWRPANSLTLEDKGNMYNFGYKLKDGTPLYACRAPLRWEVSPGRYDIDTKSCHLGGWKQTFVVRENVEVLTIPGGLSNKCSVYKLRNKYEATRENGILSSLSFRHPDARAYVAYGQLTTNGVTENALGKLWLWDLTKNFRDYEAELQVGSVTDFQRDYKVLTCSMDHNCVMNTMFAKRCKV